MNIPKIALGTGGIMKYNNDLIDMLTAGKEAGVSHIDTAHKYDNEKQLGLDIKYLGWDDVFVTSKVNPANMEAYTSASVMESLQYVGKKIDMVLLHAPVDRRINAIAFNELIDMRDEGLIGSAGVSNFTVEQIEQLHEDTGEYPVNNQIYVSPTYFDKEMIKFCKEHDIVVSAYSTLGSYFRSEHEFSMNAEQRTYIDSLATKYNVSVSNILFRWLLDQDINIIFQSRKPERIKENLSGLEFQLTSEEIQHINSFDKGLRPSMM